MENLLKGIHLLKDMDPKTIQDIEKDAFTVWQEFKVIFKIMNITAEDVTIGITQMKNSNDNYLEKRQLINLTHSTFDGYFFKRRVIVRASPYEESPAKKVDADWIKKKMEEHGVTLKEMSEETGLNNTQLSPLTTGSKPLSDAMKAMFYFYFRSKEIKDES
jgi:hypothetical protein